MDEESRNQRIRVGFAVTSDTVFSWVQDYYALDDREQMAQKEKEAEKNFLEAIATCNEEKKTAGRQKGRGQTKKQKQKVRKSRIISQRRLRKNRMKCSYLCLMQD